MPTQALIALCTCPDRETAARIAAALVDANLAACVNILPGITSVYRWEGQRESATEALLIIKTLESRYQALEQAIREAHPYELPEIIAVSVEQGLADYLAWIGDSVQPST